MNEIDLISDLILENTNYKLCFICFTIGTIGTLHPVECILHQWLHDGLTIKLLSTYYILILTGQ